MENLEKKQKIGIIFLIGACIIVISIYFIKRMDEKEQYIETNTQEIQQTGNTIISEKKIIIHITGSVQKEGIVELEENSRISDAIEAAGGLLSDANVQNVNLAYKIKDGQKIYIPSIYDEEENETISTQNGDNIIIEAKEEITQTDEKQKININTATQTELETLPGIGPSTALKIIEYRKENGNFYNIDEIKDIPGIGEKKYEEIKDHICI